MQESRLFKLLYYLLEHGKSTAPELAEQFEVSVRTIYRDIDALSSAGIPVYAVQGKGGGISILDHYVLEKSLFSEAERDHILMALQGIIAAEGKDSDELLTKLSALFRIKATNWIEVDFSGWTQNKPGQDVFNSVKHAILHKNVLSFRYFSGSGQYSARKAEPVKLIFKSRDWYLYGYCPEQNNFRFFKLTRIRDLEILSETFSHEFSLPAIEKQIRPEKTVKVKLKFDERIAFRVYDEFTDEAEADGHGNLYVQTELPDSDMLFSYLLSFADCVEVIAPASVRERMMKKLRDIQSKYRT